MAHLHHPGVGWPQMDLTLPPHMSLSEHVEACRCTPHIGLENWDELQCMRLRWGVILSRWCWEYGLVDDETAVSFQLQTQSIFLV